MKHIIALSTVLVMVFGACAQAQNLHTIYQKQVQYGNDKLNVQIIVRDDTSITTGALDVSIISRKFVGTMSAKFYYPENDHHVTVTGNDYVDIVPALDYQVGELIRLQATDTGGNGSSFTYAYSRTGNSPPSIDPIDDIALVEGSGTYTFQPSATDPESGDISYWLFLGSPGMVSISADLVTIDADYVGAGGNTYSITVLAVDDGNGTANRRFDAAEFDVRILKIVTFSDAQLEAAIRLTDEVPSAGQITDAELESLSGTLDLSSYNISDLSGLQYAAGATGLTIIINGEYLDSDPSSNNNAVISALNNAPGVTLNISNRKPFVVLPDDVILESSQSTYQLAATTLADPDSDSTPTLAWSVDQYQASVSGSFTDSTINPTTFENISSGIYVISLTADDGEFTVSDSMEIFVRPSPSEPSTLPSGTQPPLAITLTNPSNEKVFYYIDSQLSGAAPALEEFIEYNGETFTINVSQDIYTFTTADQVGVDPRVAISSAYEFRIGSPVGTGDGLVGSYYPESNFDAGDSTHEFTGSPLSRVDNTINFNWGSGEPITGLGVDDFGVIWEGEVETQYSEDFEFSVTADDGFRLWVGGELVAESWQTGSSTVTSDPLPMAAGERRTIRLEYFDDTGTSSMKLEWRSSLSLQALEVVPQSQLYSTLPVVTAPATEPLNAPTATIDSQAIDPILFDDEGYISITSESQIAFAAGAGQVIRYTVNGQLPDGASPVYTTPLQFSDESVVVMARAYESGENPSAPFIGRFRLDNDGPTLTNLAFNGVNLPSDPDPLLTIDDLGSFSVDVHDTSGVDQVVFKLNDGSGEKIFGTASNGVATVNADEWTFSIPFNPVEWPNGSSYTITATAYDELGTVSDIILSENFEVNLKKPPSPVIASSLNGVSVNTDTIKLFGTATVGFSDHLTIYQDNISGLELADNVSVSGDGKWSVQVKLLNGPNDTPNSNSIIAVATNRDGDASDPSAAVTIYKDTSIPPAPIGLNVRGVEDTAILTWRQPAYVGQIDHYDIYVDTAPITSTSLSGLTPISTSALVYAHEGLTNQQTYYFRIKATNSFGTSSGLSKELKITIDSEAPALDGQSASGGFIYSFVPDSTNPTDYYEDVFDGPDAYGPGELTITITTNESLSSPPTFYFEPSSGFPIKVNLVSSASRTYKGTISLDEHSAQGVMTPKFTVRDASGNEQTLTLNGEGALDRRVEFDTRGPRISAVSAPADMYWAIDPAVFTDVSATVILDKPVPDTVIPSFSLHRPANDDTISSNTTTESGPMDKTEWTFDFTIVEFSSGNPLNGSSEILELEASIANRFGLVETSTPNGGPFTIYTDPDAPTGLIATALPPLNVGHGGAVKLDWMPGELVENYQIWRRPSGFNYEFVAQVPANVTNYTDENLVDGPYDYFVSSVIGTAQSQAVQSNEVNVTVDGTGPSAPAFVQEDTGDPSIDHGLQPDTNGILARWVASPDADVALYRLYRVETPDDVLIVETTATEALDATPTSSSANSYYIVAVDNIGNVSNPSATLQFSALEQLPVTDVKVFVSESDVPTVTWTHLGDVAEYTIEVRDPITNVLIKPSAMQSGSLFVDNGFSGKARRYVITPYFSSDPSIPGVSRTVDLPIVELGEIDSLVLRTNLMNAFELSLNNAGKLNVSESVVSITLSSDADFDALVEPIPAFAEMQVMVPIAGDSRMAVAGSVESLTINWIYSPANGCQIHYQWSASAEVRQGILPVEVFAEGLTRGSTGQVGFSITNTSPLPIDLITAHNYERDPSDDIGIYLLSEDDDLLQSTNYFQINGAGNLPAGSDRIQRIEPGERFDSDLMPIAVPSSAENEVIVQVEIATIYFDRSGDEEVKLDLVLPVRKTFSTQALDYDVIITHVETDSDPASGADDVTAVSFKREPVIIRGQVVEPSDGDPATTESQISANLPIYLKIQKSGAEQVIATTTDSTGSFVVEVETSGIAAGEYTVDATHPDLLSRRSPQGEFLVHEVTLGLSQVELDAPVNYTQTITVPVRVAPGTTLNDLELRLDPSVPFPSGDIQCIISSENDLISVASDVTFKLTVSGLDAVSSVDTHRFELVSDVGGNEVIWDALTFKYAFSANQPVLIGYDALDRVINNSLVEIDLGVVRGESASTEIFVTNEGFATARNLSVSLLDGANEAPQWLSMLTPVFIPSIEKDGYARLVIAAEPPSSVPFGASEYVLRITGDNFSGLDLNLNVHVADPNNVELSEATFHIINPYYGLGANAFGITNPGTWAQWANGVANARVTLIKDDVDDAAGWFDENATPTKLTINSSDAALHGRATFENITPGRYRVTVTAPGHGTYNGFAFIKPGFNYLEEIRLNYSPVQVSWEVVPTTIQDRYDILVETQFETQVPIPVIVAEPSYINLTNVCPGEVYNGEYRVTNHGLIRAFNIDLNFFESDQYYRFELMDDVPDSLEAGQTVRIPFRITCLQTIPGITCSTGTSPQASNLPSDLFSAEHLIAGPTAFLTTPISSPLLSVLLGSAGANSGGGYKKTSSICADYVCPWNPDAIWRSCGSSGCGITTSGDISSNNNPFPPSVGGGDGRVKSGPGSGGSTSSPSTPTTSGGGSSYTAKCKPPVFCDDPCCGSMGTGAGGGGGGAMSDDVPANNGNGCPPNGDYDRGSPTNSWVDLVDGSYRDQVEDLRVIVPGGYVNFARYFNGDNWELKPRRELSTALKSKVGATPILNSNVPVAAQWVHYRELSYQGYVAIHNGSYNELTSEFTPDPSTISIGDKFREHDFYYNEIDDTYRFTDLETKQWREFDGETGRIVAFGYLDTLVAEYDYADDTTLLPDHVLDNAENIVLTFGYDSNDDLTSLIDWSGRSIDYGYTDGKLTSVTYNLESGFPVVETYGYDDDGFLTSKTTMEGGDVVITYDDDGRVTSMIDETGVGKFYEYGFDQNATYGNGTVTFDVDPSLSGFGVGVGIIDGERTYVQLNGKGVHYAVETTTEGVTTEYFFDAYGSLFEKRINGVRVLYRETQGDTLVETIGENEVTRTTYNYLGKVISEKLPGGGTREYEWDPTTRLLKRFTDAIGTVYTFGHDAKGNMTSRTEGFGTPIQRTWTYDYQNDPYNRVQERTDPRGVKMKYEYLGGTSLKTREYYISQPAYQTTYTYDSIGRPTSLTDALGRTTYLGFDDKDRLLWAVNALGYAMVNTYDANGVLEKKVSGLPGADVGLMSAAVNGSPVAYWSEYGKWDSIAILDDMDQLDDSMARIELYEYDAMGRRTHTYRVDKAGTPGLYEEVTYNEGGKIASVANALSQTTNIGYDAFGNASVFQEPFNGVVTSDTVFTYDALGREIQQVDPLLFATEFGYDNSGRMSYVIEPENRQRAYEYDAEGQLIAVTITDGEDTYTTRFEYDALGRQTRRYGDLVAEQTFGYDVNDNLTSITDGRGYVRQYTYDDYNRLIRTSIEGEITGELGYDLVGNLIWIRDGKGNTTYYAYDALNRRTHESIPQAPGYLLNPGWENNSANVLWEMTYNPWGQLTKSRNYSGAVSTLEYDHFGNLINVTDFNGLHLKFEYDADDNLIEVLWPAEPTSGSTRKSTQKIIRSEHNAAMVIASIDRQGFETEFEYDLKFRPVGSFNQAGGAVYTLFDGLDRVIEEWNNVDDPGINYQNAGTSPETTPGNSTQYVYGVFDEVKQIIYPDEKLEERRYDRLGRLRSINADWQTETVLAGVGGSMPVVYEYDAVGNMTKLKTFYGESDLVSTTRWEYNAKDQILYKYYPDNSFYSYTYDLAGNPASRTDGLGRTTEYTFNKFNRLAEIDYHNDPTVTIEYDAMGRAVKLFDGSTSNPAVPSTTWSYVGGDLQASTSQEAAGTTINYLFNQEGARTLMKVQGSLSNAPADPWTTVYSYNYAGYIERIFDDQVSATQGFVYTYNSALGDIDSISLPNGMKIERGYDVLGRLNQLDGIKSDLSTLTSHVYTIDVLNMVDTHDYTQPSVSSQRDYDYNQYLMLAQADDPSTTGAIDYQYDFDAIGNRLETILPDGIGGFITTDYTPTNLNQYSDIDVGALNQQPQYDINGNLTDKEGDSDVDYVYDEENRLIQIWYDGTGSGDYTEFTYDGMGRRVKAVEYDDNVETDLTHYVYDGLLVIQELDEDGAVKRQLTRGVDLSGWNDGAGGAGGLLAVTQLEGGSLETFYAVGNGGGSVAALFDNNQNPVASYEYDPFGNRIDSYTDAVVQPYRFSTQEWHERSGLYLYTFRGYDPNTGRWLNRDPAGEAGGVNLYAFTGNDPINKLDRYGLMPWCKVKNLLKEANRPGIPPLGFGAASDAIGDMLGGDGLFSGLQNLLPDAKTDPLNDSWGALFANSAQDYFVGITKGVLGVGAGLESMAKDPIGTVNIIANALSDPVGTLNAIKNDYISKIKSPMGIGEVVGEFLVDLATGGVGKGVKAAKGGGIPGCFTEDTLVLTSEELVPIAEISVGDRVMTPTTVANGEAAGLEIEPEQWRLVSLVMAYEFEGQDAVFELETLQHIDDIERENMHIGEYVYLSMPELGVDGEFLVIDVAPCPEITDGPGRIVMSTFKRSMVGGLLEIDLGEGAPIRCTDTHLFYSLTRKTWLSAEELQKGELLHGIYGSKPIQAIKPISLATAVYNLEVEGEHIYLVGKDCLLVHNACEKLYRTVSAAEAKAMKDANGLVPKPHPHQNNPKWIADNEKAHKPSPGEKLVTMFVDEGTTDWLKSLSKDIDEWGKGEKGLPDGVLTKGNEAGAYGVGVKLIDEFNKKVQKVCY